MLSAKWGRQGEGRGGQKAMPSHHEGAGGAHCVLCAAAHRSVFYCRLVLMSMVGLVSPLPTLYLAQHVWDKKKKIKVLRGIQGKKKEKKITSTLHSDHPPHPFLDQP